jgi:hypothetical protein
MRLGRILQIKPYKDGFMKKTSLLICAFLAISISWTFAQAQTAPPRLTPTPGLTHFVGEGDPEYHETYSGITVWGRYHFNQKKTIKRRRALESLLEEQAPTAAITALAIFDRLTSDEQAMMVWEGTELAVSQFRSCGDYLGNRAAAVTMPPIVLEPGPFRVPYPNGQFVDAVGVTFPNGSGFNANTIHIVNLYINLDPTAPTFSWVRDAKALSQWEGGNWIAIALSLLAEPRSANWPCDAPFHQYSFLTDKEAKITMIVLTEAGRINIVQGEEILDLGPWTQ